MSSTFDVAQYLSRAVARLAADALRASIKNPRETAYILKFSAAARKAEKTRMRHENNGRHIPAFLIASISTQCNLFCTGCYARANQSCGDNAARDNLPASKWSEIFAEARDIGVSFILLAGGEPLLRKDVIDAAARYPEIIFPTFTNGTMIGDDYLRTFDRHRNIIPILSMEGSREQTDARRGPGIYDRLTGVMDRLQAGGILYGVSITVTVGNIDAITDPAFIAELSAAGCKIVFFIEYVPVTADTRGQAPGDPERRLLENRQNLLRTDFPDIMFISFPGDEKHTGGCLAAGRGFFHINADGGAEPCPFSPYSDISVRDHSLLEALDSRLFVKLKTSGMLIGEHTGGCLLFEKEEDVIKFLAE